MSSVPSPLIELDEVDSTNAEALRRAAGGERGPLWIMAHRQTHGRGRSGRIWQDATGNLMATMLLAPGCASTALHQLSLLAGVAAHDAIASRANSSAPAIRLKWPNDLLVDGAKLGGILVESTMHSSVAVAAIGIGVNIAIEPEISGRRVTSLRAAGYETPHPRELLRDLDVQMNHWLAVWAAGAGFEMICAAWLERAGPIGEEITVHAGSDIVRGTFAGLAPDGALLVQDRNGTVSRVTAGDVSLSASDR